MDPNIIENELNSNMLKNFNEFLHDSINQSFYANINKKDFLNGDLNNNENIALKNFDFTKKSYLINENEDSCEEEVLKTEIIKNQREAVIVCPSNLQNAYNDEKIYCPIPRNIITDSAKPLIDDKHILKQIILHRKNPEKIGLLTFVDKNEISTLESKPNNEQNMLPEIPYWKQEHLKTNRMASRRTSAPACLWPPSLQPGFLKQTCASHNFIPQVNFLYLFVNKNILQLFSNTNDINSSTENFTINLNIFQKLLQQSLQTSALTSCKEPSQQAFMKPLNGPFHPKTPSTSSSPDSGLGMDPAINDLSKSFLFNKIGANSTTHIIPQFPTTNLNGNQTKNCFLNTTFQSSLPKPQNWGSISNLDWFERYSNFFYKF